MVHVPNVSPFQADPLDQTADSFVGARRYRSGLLGFLLLRFADSNDEAAFVQSQTAVSTGLFRKMIFACGIVNLFYAAVSIQQGSPDPVPLLATPLALAVARAGDEYLRNARLRLLVLVGFAVHLNMRFSVGVFWGDKSFAPPTVLSSQPLPYSLLGPAALLALAAALGLRMRDSIAVVLPTLATGVLHQIYVLPRDSRATAVNYGTSTAVITLVGYCAGYHAECTKRRRWMWYPRTYTLHPAPCTLHPAPYTRNSKPETRNPKP